MPGSPMPDTPIGEKAKYSESNKYDPNFDSVTIYM